MRSRRSIICPTCSTDTFYHCKGKCVPCYEREKRQKPEYKEKQRRYALKHRERLREYQRRYREKYMKAPRNARKPLRHSTPLPRPAKRLRPVSNSPRRREIRRKDKAFQVSGERNWCAVGHWAEETHWHHRISRRHLKTRWDKTVCFRLCLAHHEEVERIEEKAFLRKYPQVLKNPEGIPPGSE